ncbi:phosphopantetheine-binding protein [Micromonospora sp. NPDC023956]|uniref:phosphopantetheine-binding protein n=1 Tax=Micromonospora sp. NPDC023956 TaxID=3155722 RepID=UPI0033C89704
MTTSLTLSDLRADVAEMLFLEPEELSDADDLLEQGLDSIRAVQLVERWRERGAEVSFIELVERPTLAHWWTLITSRSSGGAHA